MYERIVGQKAKIVHKDGDRICVTQGTIKAWDASIATILIRSERTDTDTYINASCIEKLEVLEEDP